MGDGGKEKDVMGGRGTWKGWTFTTLAHIVASDQY